MLWGYDFRKGVCQLALLLMPQMLTAQAGQLNSGLDLELSVSSRPIPLGDSFLLRVLLRNGSATPVRISPTLYPSVDYLELQVRDENGKVMKSPGAPVDFGETVTKSDFYILGQ